MNRLRLIIPLLLTLGCNHRAAVVTPVVPAIQLDAIWPLRHSGVQFCTVFSINEQQGYYMTAKHCVEPDAGQTFHATTAALNQPAHVVYEDPNWDIAVVQSAAHSPA